MHKSVHLRIPEALSRLESPSKPPYWSLAPIPVLIPNAVGVEIISLKYLLILIPRICFDIQYWWLEGAPPDDLGECIAIEQSRINNILQQYRINKESNSERHLQIRNSPITDRTGNPPGDKQPIKTKKRRKGVQLSADHVGSCCPDLALADDSLFWSKIYALTLLARPRESAFDLLFS